MKKISLSLVVASSILVCNSFASDLLSEKRKAALEALGGPNVETVVTTQEKDPVEVTEMKKQIIETTIPSVEIANVSNTEVDNLAIKELMARIQLLELKLKNQQSTADLEEKIIKLEKLVSLKASSKELEFEIEKIKADDYGSEDTEELKEIMDELEEEIVKVTKDSKYQLYKISSLEDFNADFDNKLNNFKQTGVLWSGNMKAGGIVESGSDNSGNSRFYIDSELNGSKNINDKLVWSGSFNFTNTMHPVSDLAKDEDSTTHFMEEMKIQYKYSDKVNFHFGKDKVKVSLANNENETIGISDPLYKSYIYPDYSVGVSVEGEKEVKNVKYDYYLSVGNGIENYFETNDSKVIVGQVRATVPFFDFTRFGFSVFHGEDTRSDSVLADYYKKTAFGLSLEVKEGNWIGSMEYIHADYSSESNVATVEDFTRKAFSLNVAYEMGKWTPWVSYDYLDLDKMYNVDLASGNLRDSNGALLPAYTGMTDVEDTYRIGVGAKYQYDNTTSVHFDQYFHKDGGASSMITLNVKF